MGLNSSQEVLIIFTRYPAPGAAKTRLIPALGTRGAADLQRQMTENLIGEAERIQQRRQTDLEIRYAGGDRAQMLYWLGPSKPCRPQGTGNLGARLQRAAADAFGAGRQRVVLVGADCPGLKAALLEEAFERLRSCDLVVGPARDGGYYLLGLRRLVPSLFAAMPWGSDQVLARTLEQARLLSLSFSLLEPLADVDRPEDLAHIHHHSRPE